MTMAENCENNCPIIRARQITTGYASEFAPLSDQDILWRDVARVKGILETNCADGPSTQQVEVPNALRFARLRAALGMKSVEQSTVTKYTCNSLLRDYYTDRQS